MARTLLIATHNAHKTGEMRAILGEHFESITDLTTLPGMTPPDETGSTFAENSEIKALAASRAMPEAFVLADDSGLEVDALGGAPGIYSSRFSGDNANDATNREKLLAELARPEHASAPRTARFRCAVTVAKGGTVISRFDGTVEGRIEPPPTPGLRREGSRGVENGNYYQPPSRPGPGKDIDETSLWAVRTSVMVAVHPAARQGYAGLTVVLAFEPV